MELAIAEVFIDTVDDLRKRSILRGTDYDAVQAAGLMRRLLLDDKKLIHRANKLTKAKIEFRWHPIMVLGTPRLVVATPMVDPVVGRPALLAYGLAEKVGAPRFGNIDAFLRMTVVRYGGGANAVTAGQLIAHYANRMGGVHVDMDRTVDNPALKEALEEIPDQLRAIIASLGRVTVAGLDPLAATLYFKHYVQADQ